MGDGPASLFAGWKLRPPALPTSLGDMPVTARIAAAVERVPFVSMVAPAGSGKTTALATWSSTQRLGRVLWVRLDLQDDDPYVLAAALTASVQQTVGRPPARLDQLLSSSMTADVRQLASALALDLDEIGDLVVVLDDAHHLRTAESIQFLTSLLDDLGPSCHIITASRVEPPLGLAQRRVRRTAVEITAADLRLDRAQVAGLLADSGVHDDALAEMILDRSGGWAAAAVLLAANATSITPTNPPRVEPLAADLDIDAFLRAEVLEPLEPELRNFVLQTSLLVSLDEASCTAVTGTRHAALRLEEIRRRGLVERVGTTPDGTRPAFRYHDRIAAFLRAELGKSTTPEELRSVHRRAAVVSPPIRAIELLLEIGDIDEASGLVAEVARTMLDTPGARVPRTWFAPFEEAQLASRPWLAVVAGLAAVEEGDIATGMARLAPAVGAMREAADRPGLVRAAYGLAEAHLAWGQVNEAGALISELLELDITSDERAKVLMAGLWLRYFGGDWAGVSAGLEEAFSLALTSCTETGRCAVALGLGTEFLFAPLGVTWLSDWAAELGRRIDRDVMALTNLDLVRAAAHLVTGQVTQAQAVAVSLDERALELGSLNWLAMAADRVRLGVALTVQDTPGVEAIVDTARRLLAESDRHRQERAMYAYAIARSGAIEGRLERLRSARLLIGQVTPEDRPDTAVTAAVIEAAICREHGDLAGAEASLDSVRDLHRQVRFCLLTGLVDLELAGVQLLQGRRHAAVDTARPMLVELSRMDGIGLLRLDGPQAHMSVLEACRTDPEVGQFVQHALRVLAEPVKASGLFVADTGERLTTRELDVLRLVIDGRSNRSIAEQLYIGERTVKTHMTSLMRKLGVTSRAAAIARCRKLGLS